LDPEDDDDPPDELEEPEELDEPDEVELPALPPLDEPDEVELPALVPLDEADGDPDPEPDSMLQREPESIDASGVAPSSPSEVASGLSRTEFAPEHAAVTIDAAPTTEQATKNPSFMKASLRSKGVDAPDRAQRPNDGLPHRGSLVAPAP
jgi:hypothetical protein